MTEQEHKVLKAILAMVPDSERPPSSDSELSVSDLADGGMGSIRFIDSPDKSRKMRRDLITAEYTDEDQIPVLISINVDEDGQLFELDFWKVNFKPLKRYPQPEEVHIAPPATIGI